MKNKSIAQQKFGEINYKRLNAHFPGVEGSFLLGFDAIAVMCELMGKRIQYNYGSGIAIGLNKRAYIDFRFDICKKRMILNNHGFNKNLVAKEIKEKYNIFTTYNVSHAGYHGIYEFKYNQKNCKRMLNIIELIIMKDWSDK